MRIVLSLAKQGFDRRRAHAAFTREKATCGGGTLGVAAQAGWVSSDRARDSWQIHLRSRTTTTSAAETVVCFAGSQVSEAEPTTHDSN
jgi:hypothetical protein